MVKRTFAFVAIAATLACLPTPSLAAPSYAGAPAAATALYDDPSVHFVPPPGFTQLSAPTVELGDHLTPVAGFIQNRGRSDQLLITVSLMNYEASSFDGFGSAVEQELRSQIDGALIRRNSERLHNGMPAYFLKVAYGEGFDSMLQFGYAVYDGRRAIYVAVAGHVGVVDDGSAHELLKNLAVVVYPRRR